MPTVTVTTQVEKEVHFEVSFPSYYKKDENYYAFLEENKMVALSVNERGVSLRNEGIMWKYDATKIMGAEQITEDDFQFALCMALDRLSKFQTVNV